MLVLSRTSGDSIVIDGSIKVTVIEVRGNLVRLGVEAPQELRVHRGELAARIRAPKRARLSA